MVLAKGAIERCFDTVAPFNAVLAVRSALEGMLVHCPPGYVDFDLRNYPT